MAKLTEAHIEQIKSMREDGKTYQEIRDFPTILTKSSFTMVILQL